MTIDYHISLHQEPPVLSRHDNDRGILATAYEILDEANASLPEGRRVFRSTIRQIVSREATEPQAFRSVIDFLNTVENPQTNTPTPHKDLLPQGHPLGNPAPRIAAATFYLSDPRVSEEIRPLLASAVAAEPNSAARKYYVARLEARKVPQSVLSIVIDADETVL